MLSTLDSIENLDDMSLYLDYVETAYNDNKDNPIGSYFGIEWLKYAEPPACRQFSKCVARRFSRYPSGKAL